MFLEFTDEFMRVQQEEFALGRRHLANMMGKDPETFTQEDINVRKEIFMTSAIRSGCHNNGEFVCVRRRLSGTYFHRDYSS